MKQWGVLVIGLSLAAASITFEYAIYRPYVVQRTAAFGGYWSDLYPRWYGARELLLHHRDPYSAEITREIQIGFMGAVVPDPKEDQSAFAYPLYVVIPFAPFVFWDFSRVILLFAILSWLAAVLSVPLWAKALGLGLSRTDVAVFTLGTVSSFPALAGIVLQQPSLFVLPLLGIAFMAASRGWLFCAGSVLALATVKPQLSALPALLLLIWTCHRFRDRKALIWGFAVALFSLWAVCEMLLPGWVGKWWLAAKAYTAYTGPSLLQMLLGKNAADIGAGIAVAAYTALAFGIARKHSLGSTLFSLAIALGFLIEIILMGNAPKGLYNQVLLLPVVLVLWKVLKHCRNGWVRALAGVASVWLVMPWVIALFAVVGAAFGNRPARPTFAPFNVALFFPLIALALVSATLVCVGREGQHSA